MLYASATKITLKFIKNIVRVKVQYISLLEMLQVR